MKRFIAYSAAALTAISTFADVASADDHADKAMMAAVEARQAQMTLISYNMSILGAMAKGEASFDTARATAAATSLAATAKLDRSLLWVAGSIQGDVPDTRAKADIWSDAAGFEKAATDFETAADALVTAAGTDLAALQAGMKAAGDTCGACHKPYRGPKN